MNSRERVLTALPHQRADRTPRDFWAGDPIWTRLLNHTGHADRETVLRALGIDLRLLDADSPPELDQGAVLALYAGAP